MKKVPTESGLFSRAYLRRFAVLRFFVAFLAFLRFFAAIESTSSQKKIVRVRDLI